MTPRVIFPYTPDAISFFFFLVKKKKKNFFRRFPLTPRVIFSREFLIHFSCWFSLVRSFPYTSHALFIREEFLLHS